MMKGFEAKAQMIREDDTIMIYDYTGYDPDESVPKHGNSPFPLQKDALQEVFQKKRSRAKTSLSQRCSASN